MINTLKNVPVLSSFDAWLELFEGRVVPLKRYGTHSRVELSAREKALITPSIRDFQKGEGSEGKHLMAQAKAHPLLGQSEAYQKLVKLFVDEENVHSGTLAQFMAVEEIPVKADKSFLDGIFRWARHQAGLELSVRILMSAEVLGLVYYDHLSRATDSTELKKICQNFLEDECLHLVFESWALAQVMRKRSWLVNVVIQLLHYGFVGVTAVALWAVHRSLFKAAGGRFTEYLRDAMTYISFCHRLMDAVAYKTAPAIATH